MPVNWLVCVSRTCREDVIKVGWTCCQWIYMYFLLPKVNTLCSQANKRWTVCTWIIDLLAGTEAWGQSCHSFVTTAANILGLSASLWNSFLFVCLFLVLCMRPLTDEKRHMLWMFISKKSQQRLTFGCQLKEDTNYRYSACIWKLRCFMCPFCGLVDRRLCLPFPDSSQRGVCRVVIVMP